MSETFAVLDGRTPLADFHSQYSQLWPYAAAIVLSLTSATTAVWTTSMATISGLALLAVYATFRRIVRSSPARARALRAVPRDRLLPPSRLRRANRFSLAGIFSAWPLRYAGPYLLAWLRRASLRRRVPTPHAAAVHSRRAGRDQQPGVRPRSACRCGTRGRLRAPPALAPCARPARRRRRRRPRRGRRARRAADARTRRRAAASRVGAGVPADIRRRRLVHQADGADRPAHRDVRDVRGHARDGGRARGPRRRGAGPDRHARVERPVRPPRRLLLRRRQQPAHARDALLGVVLRARAAGRRGRACARARSARRPSAPELAVLFGFGLAVCSLPQIPAPWSAGRAAGAFTSSRYTSSGRLDQSIGARVEPRRAGRDPVAARPSHRVRPRHRRTSPPTRGRPRCRSGASWSTTIEAMRREGARTAFVEAAH